MRRRTVVLIGMLALVTALQAWVLVRYGLSLQSPQDEWTAARSVPNTDVNPYGANFFLDREVEPWKRKRTVEMAQESGLGWAKQQFSWAEIEPLHKGEFIDPVSRESSWAKFDEIVDLYREHNIQVIARLDRTPAWARPEDTRPETPPTDLEDFGDFVYAFVEHLGGRVQHIQIWNEPNIYPEWGEQAADPVAYAEMLRIAYRRAKEANPNVHVLSAPLAVTLGEPHPEPGKWRSIPDLDYLEALYKSGAGDSFDILSANAFGFDLPPADPPDPTVLNFRRVELQREIMERYGDVDKAVWFNEYGWNAAPDSFDDDALTWERVSEEKQAEYTLEGIEFGRREWPWAGVFNVWYFRQVGHQYSPDDPAYYFRMVDVDFTPRRMYDAVQDATSTLSVAGAGHFEETHPAVTADAPWHGVISEESSGQAHVEAEEPGASLKFTFRGNSVDLIARTDPLGGRLLVTLDGHTVSSLPTDSEGRSYLELQAASSEGQARLPIASGLSSDQHIVRLTVGDGEQTTCNVDAFEVSAGHPPAFPLLPVVGMGLAALIVAGILAWTLYNRPRREKFF
ncbi:hypothetical protein ACFLUM_03290 [Chloroflexota bacterium]